MFRYGHKYSTWMCFATFARDVDGFMHLTAYLCPLHSHLSFNQAFMVSLTSVRNLKTLTMSEKCISFYIQVVLIQF